MEDHIIERLRSGMESAYRQNFSIRTSLRSYLYTAEWKLEIINLTNHKNELRTSYENATQSVEVEYQNHLIPMLTYRIQF